jgi:2-(1,2-epoxy-1,2-dihydrophenyl)acetyl-CoA isomerase
MTTAAPDGVAIEARDGALHIALDRPAHKNALDHAAIRRLVAALESAATDDSLRVVHLTGRGADFCSGADWVASNAKGARAAHRNLSRRTKLQAHR